MSVKTEEYIKYLTQRVVNYIDQPAEVRKEQRSLQKSTREPWQVRWFGMVPLSMMMWWTQTKRRKLKLNAKKEHPRP
ncbi:MAG: YqzE family protein [Paenibacillus sp.]|jgi:hypothetical protein|nr:YqzE family protein [Paenibacillus sp.]